MPLARRGARSQDGRKRAGAESMCRLSETEVGGCNFLLVMGAPVALLPLIRELALLWVGEKLVL